MYTLDEETLKNKKYSIINFTDKRVLVRTCLNVITNENWDMIDDTRYNESLPLLRELSEKAKMVLITAHLWRPKANESKYSFVKIADKLSNDLWKKIKFVSDLKDLQDISQWIYFLENVRFFPAEDSNDTKEKKVFTDLLVKNCDLFINDAFADYRPSVSTYDIAKRLPSYLGPVFYREINELNKLNHSAKPFVAVLGWSKLSEKLDSLLALLQVADKVLIWWAMRYTLLKAMGISVWDSLIEQDKSEIAKEIISTYKDKLVLPLDHMIVREFKDPAQIGYEYTINQTVPQWHEAIDIWPKWIQQFTKELSKAKTIVRNWPMGVFEWDISAHGTLEIGKAIAQNTSAYRLIGWWDSLAAINKLWLTWFNHVSTWGGAMLSYLAYDKFPILDVILYGK